MILNYDLFNHSFLSFSKNFWRQPQFLHVQFLNSPLSNMVLIINPNFYNESVTQMKFSIEFEVEILPLNLLIRLQ